MKQVLTFVFLISFLSCTHGQNDRINEFEKSLGEIETRYFNELVNDFDLFLNKKYKDEEFKFKKYLTEISESNQPDIWKIDKNKLEQINKTNLFAKYDSIYPDSVWYDNNVFNISYSDSDVGITNSIALINKENKESNIDSIINSLKSKPRLKEIEPSYFQIALESIVTKDSLIQKYLDARKTAGTISIRLIAGGLLHDLKPENEYFAKRIIIMQMND